MRWTESVTWKRKVCHAGSDETEFLKKSKLISWSKIEQILIQNLMPKCPKTGSYVTLLDI